MWPFVHGRPSIAMCWVASCLASMATSATNRMSTATATAKQSSHWTCPSLPKQHDCGTADTPQSTIATALEQHLLHKGLHSFRLDGDNIRFGLNKDLGFDPNSRVENVSSRATG